MAGVPRCNSLGPSVSAPARVNLRISGTYSNVLGDDQVVRVPWDAGSLLFDIESGAGDGLADTALSSNSQALADAASVNWDIYDLSESGNDIGNGVGSDMLGLGHCSARICALLIQNKSDSQGALVVGNAATNKWTGFISSTGTVTLPAGSLFMVGGPNADGMAVDGSTNFKLKLAASGGGVDYGIHWVGSSA